MMTKEQNQAADDTIKAVLEVAPAPHRADLAPQDSTYYLIETTLSFPRYVVGEVIDLEQNIVGVRQILRCGAEWSAREFWRKLTEQGEQAATISEVVQ
jgi:hypothetical protein